MRQGVDTVKPDVHVRRFAEAAVDRKLSDQDVIELTTRAAARIGVRGFEFDWRIWEASRGGTLPYPTSRPAPVTPFVTMHLIEMSPQPEGATVALIRLTGSLHTEGTAQSGSAIGAPVSQDLIDNFPCRSDPHGSPGHNVPLPFRLTPALVEHLNLVG
jgi:hypothetical protein